MSRTKERNERTGEYFPKKSRRKLKDRKYFGHRKGDGSVPNAVKNEDYINYGWPCDLRGKDVIKLKIQNELAKKEIDEYQENDRY
jgi:hypothetical protein